MKTTTPRQFRPTERDDPRDWFYPAADAADERGLNCINVFLRFYPEIAEAYVFRGGLFDELQLLNEAMADFNEAIRLNPGYADAYNKRGQTYSSLGQNELAIKEYSEAIRLDPDLILAYLNRAVAYATVGRDADSDHDIAHAEELRPGVARDYDLFYSTD